MNPNRHSRPLDHCLAPQRHDIRSIILFKPLAIKSRGRHTTKVPDASGNAQLNHGAGVMRSTQIREIASRSNSRMQ